MGITIMAVDDNRNILKIVRLFLTKEGHNVITHNNAFDGLEELKKSRVDLILMDVMMPKMSGFDAIAKLQEDPKTARVPVILMTAKAVIQHSSPEKLWRVYGYLTKPFTHSQLIGKINEVVKAVQLQQPQKEEDPGTMEHSVASETTTLLEIPELDGAKFDDYDENETPHRLPDPEDIQFDDDE